MEWKESYILSTADVTSLYTIIFHQHGSEAVDTFLRRDTGLLSIQKDFVLRLIDFTMSHSYFWFGSSFYVQNRGVVMGAKFAPSMANMFMAKWEEDVIYANRRPELFGKGEIDDVLPYGMVICNCSVSSLSNVMTTR